MTTNTHNGWEIVFRKNVHMSYHSLKVKKEGIEYDVPCEDLAVCDGVGIWPYDLNMDENKYSDLLVALRQWVKDQGFEYRLYTTRERFESNK